MNLLQILVLAVVQGITEFLPISSSGHLLLVPLLTGWPDQGLSLDIATHVGTLVAVIAYFRADVIYMLSSLVSRGTSEEVKLGRQLAYHVIIGSIPALLAGALLFFVANLDLRSLLMIAIMTLFFGVVLGIADRFFKGNRLLKDMNSWDALFIGIFQIFALFPGTSRSGVTMTAALLRGLDRTEAARFSMLLSIPVIAGAGFAVTTKIIVENEMNLGIDALIASVVSFLVAYVAIKALMSLIAKISFMPFVWYRIVLGVFLIAVYVSS
ncbi:MAG: undecaprenyl-diphosphate phosphatase [Sneathiella sp.]|nr:undecaprenyl-diphosphate phosphatase [Sneathiella sp.]